MNNIQALIMASTLLWLTACTSLPQPIWYQSTAQLLEQQHYKKALQQIQSQQPINKKQLEKVKGLAKKLRLKSSKTFQRLVTQKEWAKAKKLLRELAFKLPHHPDFLRWEKQLNEAYQDEQRLIKTEQALAQAQLLKVQFKQQDLTRRSHETYVNWFNNKQQLTEKKQLLAEQLIHLSTQAIATRDYTNAQTAYAQAIEFDQQLSQEPLHQAINNWLTQQNHQAIKKRQASLIRQLRNAINKQNFKQLMLLENILSKAPFSGQVVIRMLKTAHALRQETASSLNRQADIAYRNGDISQAITLWQHATQLTPNQHDMQRKLSRARKVQKKLDKLTAKQTSN
ncbi:hypothetical protein A9Q73_10515 [Bermanella sp. 47_1433_sub80_T6]|nr:hypothetical protein A9Q73_10515 [Bermanella sp. 47_1433_sub80_T6]